jgi:hypothetical protein
MIQLNVVRVKSIHYYFVGDTERFSIKTILQIDVSCSRLIEPPYEAYANIGSVF